MCLVEVPVLSLPPTARMELGGLFLRGLLWQQAAQRTCLYSCLYCFGKGQYRGSRYMRRDLMDNAPCVGEKHGSLPACRDLLCILQNFARGAGCISRSDGIVHFSLPGASP